MSTGGEVANALVCKTSIRGFNSLPVLHLSFSPLRTSPELPQGSIPPSTQNAGSSAAVLLTPQKSASSTVVSHSSQKRLEWGTQLLLKVKQAQLAEVMLPLGCR
jgi:hypothetical protein